MSLKSVVPLIVCFGLTNVAAQIPSTGALVVLSKGDRTLSVVDPSTLKVVGTVPRGQPTRSRRRVGRPCRLHRELQRRHQHHHADRSRVDEADAGDRPRCAAGAARP